MYDMGCERSAELQNEQLEARVKHEINNAWLDSIELKDEPVFERSWSS